MRKNGINRTLTPIEGGVCAPKGYQANAVACGIRENGGLDFGIIYSERRCSVACVYAAGKTQGAPVKVSRKNIRNGYARAILVNGGRANVFEKDGEKLALSTCDLLFPYAVERTEIIVASTGRMEKTLTLAPFERGVRELWEGLGSSAEKSEEVAIAITEKDAKGQQLAFSFDLGDYPCKIGAVFKGGKHTSPNMATFLCFLTTDVNISTPMLQKALTAEVKETFNLLDIDGVSSPNDTTCIFANGKAGNYRIDCPDSEYKKFSRALRAVLTEICQRIAKENGRLFSCRVKGAISKEVSRASAKAIVQSSAVKQSLQMGETGVENILYTLFATVRTLQGNILLSLRSQVGEVVIFDEGREICLSPEMIKKILSGEEIEIEVDLQEGNYSSVAIGRLEY